ncbi:polyhomeotic-like protein 2 [Nerophis lumbriciformis]|uniref:polyhomeotic-like protein 2 n=1 Tax=Nerophis lumbriciformis TaxID=546530 RepID=UPI003BACCDC8
MTPGNGNTNSSHQRGGSKAVQAIVQSHILTHFIEGFVIQEGAQPFPVEHPTFSVDCLRKHTSHPRMNDSKCPQEAALTCELCGKVDFAFVFRRSKRFCSTVCAKRYNVGCTKRMSLFLNDKSPLEDSKKQRPLDEKHNKAIVECQKQKSDPHFLPSDPAHWNVDHVHSFICSLPGCLEIAEEFRGQEIDGQALLLLQEDHLLGAMNIKLGPALKIAAQISLLKDF